MTDSAEKATPPGEVELRRECGAMLIPSGMKVTLAKGTKVRVTHRLGGNFTVTGPFGMARIDGIDAGALGEPVLQAAPYSTPPPAHAQTDGASPAEEFPMPSADDLWAAAKTIFDPEIPVNIVDLGLLYRLDIYEDEKKLRRVEVDMTLTAPGCAFGPMISDDLRMRLQSIPGVDQTEVNIVWDPPWNQDMISEEGKMILGLI